MQSCLGGIKRLNQILKKHFNSKHTVHTGPSDHPCFLWTGVEERLNSFTVPFLHHKISKVGDHSRGQPEGSFFNSYYTKELERALLLSLDDSTLLLMMQGGIKYHYLNLWYDSTWNWTPVSRSPGPLANTLPTSPKSRGQVELDVTHKSISQIN